MKNIIRFLSHIMKKNMAPLAEICMRYTKNTLKWEKKPISGPFRI